MLVLSRKRNETIVINGDIRIMVVDVHGNRVRLGIEAPDTVRVLREELRDLAGTSTARWPSSTRPTSAGSIAGSR
jgi:carbon storage regulator